MWLQVLPCVGIEVTDSENSLLASSVAGRFGVFAASGMAGPGRSGSRRLQSLPAEPFSAQAKATDRWRSSNTGSRGVTRYGRSELVLSRGASMGGSAASRAGMASKPSWEGGPADPRRRSFILSSASPWTAGGVPCLARAASPWQLAMNPGEPAVLLGFATGAPDAGSARGFGASTAERGSRGCKRCGLFVAAGGLEMPVLRAAPGLQFTPVSNSERSTRRPSAAET